MGLLPPTASVAGQVRLDGQDIMAGGEASLPRTARQPGSAGRAPSVRCRERPDSDRPDVLAIGGQVSSS
jgi:hypothetical protein